MPADLREFLHRSTVYGRYLIAYPVREPYFAMHNAVKSLKGTHKGGYIDLPGRRVLYTVCTIIAEIYPDEDIPLLRRFEH